MALPPLCELGARLPQVLDLICPSITTATSWEVNQLDNQACLTVLIMESNDPTEWRFATTMASDFNRLIKLIIRPHISSRYDSTVSVMMADTNQHCEPQLGALLLQSNTLGEACSPPAMLGRLFRPQSLEESFTARALPFEESSSCV